jgi:hypothetical protein
VAAGKPPPPPFVFAMPVLHRTDVNYPDLRPLVARSRGFRQPVLSLPAGNSVDGLELYLASREDAAAVFAFFDGALIWVPASGGLPASLVLTRSSSDSDPFVALDLVEAPVARAEFENLDWGSVREALVALLTAEAVEAAKRPAAQWHPALRLVSPYPPEPRKTKKGKAKKQLPPPTLGTHLVDLAKKGGDTAGLIAKVVGDILAESAADVAARKIAHLPVRAGDRIGMAAPYRPGDSPPATPPFVPGAAGDPNRARRLTFRTIDKGGQPADPSWYLYWLLRRAGENHPRINAVTKLPAPPTRHPLAQVLPELAGNAPPAPRSDLPFGPYQAVGLPAGRLNTLHPHGSSLWRWRYADDGRFEAQDGAGNAFPTDPAAVHESQFDIMWSDFGGAIGDVCDRLHVPCEIVVGLIGTEAAPPSGGHYDQRIARFEPFNLAHRRQVRVAAAKRGELPAARAREFAYDQLLTRLERTHGQAAVATTGVRTSVVDITLDAAQKWPVNQLANWYRVLVMGATQRYPIVTSSWSTPPSDIGAGHKKKVNTLAAGTTRYFKPNARSVAGESSEDPATYTLPGPAGLRTMKVSVARNTLRASGPPPTPVPAVITLTMNGADSALTVQLAAKKTSASITLPAALELSTGDKLAIRVETQGDEGTLQNLFISLPPERRGPANQFRLTVRNEAFTGGQPQGSSKEGAAARTARNQAQRTGHAKTVYFATDDGVVGGDRKADKPKTSRAGDTHQVVADMTLRNLSVGVQINDLVEGSDPGTATVRLIVDDAPTSLVVELPGGTLAGSDTAHAVNVTAGQKLWFELVTEGTGGGVAGLLARVEAVPASGEAWIPHSYVMSVPDPGAVIPANRVDPNVSLTWSDLLQIVDDTEGDRVSPGVVQTLISTARQRSLAWLRRVDPGAFTAGLSGVTALPAGDRPRDYLLDWLVRGPNSILAGAGFVRQTHALYATGFDIPLVGAAYNAGKLRPPTSDTDKRWGLHFFGEYVERACRYHNAAVQAFSADPPTAEPSVRMVR